MNFKEKCQALFDKWKSKLSQTSTSSRPLLQEWKELWRTGKIQRTSRISYHVVWNVILFFLIIGLIGVFFAGGVGAGYFASLVKDEPVLPYQVMKQDIYNYDETSKLYFANETYLGELQSDLYREETTLKNISPHLIDAVIATEDEYFQEHKGIVPKAIVRAIFQEVTNAETKTGGSTLTQQLIKNQILTNEVSFERKAKEMLLALRLERFFEKEEILEAYLNVVPYGRNASGDNIAGIETAAQGVFGVSAKELNLAQSAYLAGLPQSPSMYTPFQNDGTLKDKDMLQYGIDRMKSVLKRMYESEYITEKEYKEASAYDVAKDFTEGSPSSIDKYPYLTFTIEDRAEKILAKQLAKKDGHSEKDLETDKDLQADYLERAKRDLRVNGYEIHTTIDKKMYDAMQKTAKEFAYYGPDRTYTKKNPNTGEVEKITEKVQTASVLIENSSGKILSFVGGRGYEDDNWNHAFQGKRSNGSTMKPLLAYAPAMEEGVIQPGSVIADYPKQIPGWEFGKPGNYSGGHYGLISAREALAKSHNFPVAEIYSKIINNDPASKYLEKMGFTSLTKGDHVHPSLSIGGMEHGVSVEENVNAFTTFGNNGKFVDAYMIEKITTKSGDVVYEHKADAVDVFSPQTTYLTVDMMRDVLTNGTGVYANSQLKHRGVDWAGKTGTSQEYKDSWFVATNPNVTFGTWIGYKTAYSLNDAGMGLSYGQRNIKLWAELINSATDVDPKLLAPSKNFQRPNGIVSRSYCAISGLLPSELCEQAGLVKSDIYNSKYVPTKVDDSLVSGGSMVVVNGKTIAAGPNTPSEFTIGDGLAFNSAFLKRKGYDKLSDLSILFPRTEREKWEKISGVGSSSGGAIKNDGKAPNTPSSLRKSGGKLTWGKSSSKDVVGYRIYQATGPGNSFSQIGHTTSTSYNINSGNARYYVKAVDYFGKESTPSAELIVGDTKKEEPEKPDKGNNKESHKEAEKPSNAVQEEQQAETTTDETDKQPENTEDDDKDSTEENQDAEGDDTPEATTEE
ncbi:transglycosylase domain-containing protein [Virgibacillus sp. Bac330]|uniref:transglycosylase domain-containing protein n=1 Tax=Virgibacillus sp. Bac330 TaxID=2419841 RepID=UPI000EF44277|nr:transglycosylase domain-containing protein [Virgibacillus sp. Bac330]